MKTNRLPTIFRSSSIAAAVLALAALAISDTANAQLKGASDDGIAASPKVRQMINERKASMTAAQPSVMNCPKCANVQTADTKSQVKGAEAMAGTAKVVNQHSCNGCEVKWTVAGEGKAKHSVANHSCAAQMPNKAACCAAN